METKASSPKYPKGILHPSGPHTSRNYQCLQRNKNTIPNRNNLRRHKKSKKNISTRTEEKRDKEVEIETEKLKGNEKILSS